MSVTSNLQGGELKLHRMLEERVGSKEDVARLINLISCTNSAAPNQVNSSILKIIDSLFTLQQELCDQQQQLEAQGEKHCETVRARITNATFGLSTKFWEEDKVKAS